MVSAQSLPASPHVLDVPDDRNLPSSAHLDGGRLCVWCAVRMLGWLARVVSVLVCRIVCVWRSRVIARVCVYSFGCRVSAGAWRSSRDCQASSAVVLCAVTL